jgi:hypothetical protein
MYKQFFEYCVKECHLEFHNDIKNEFKGKTFKYLLNIQELEVFNWRDIPVYSVLKWQNGAHVVLSFSYIRNKCVLSKLIESQLRTESTLFATWFHAGILLGLFFDTENGDDMFLRNISWLSVGCTTLYPRKYTLHNHRCGNLESYM